MGNPSLPRCWVNIGASILDSVRTAERSPAIPLLQQMASAYRHNKAAEFNAAVTQYRNWLKTDFAKEERKGSKEKLQVRVFLYKIEQILNIRREPRACDAVSL